MVKKDKQCNKENLEILKKEYLKFQKKYSLPGFNVLNEDFEIEKVVILETDFLLREIRKHMSEKVTNLLRFIELLLNPINAPMFIFSFVKNLNIEDKKTLESIYKRIVEMELDLISLDTSYSERAEAEFIKRAHKEWQEIKKGLLSVHDSIKKNWKNRSSKGNKSYFG